MKYIKNVLIAIDQLANTFIGGQPDETISAKASRMRVEHNSIPWKNMESCLISSFLMKNTVKNQLFLKKVDDKSQVGIRIKNYD